MLNVQGEVIGINTAIFAPTGVFNGIGFAIPINRAADLVGGVIDFNNMAPGAGAGQLVAWTNQGRQVGNAYRLPGGQMITPPHPLRGKCLDCHPQLFEQQAQAAPVNADLFPQQGQATPVNVDPFLQQGRGMQVNVDPFLQQQGQGMPVNVDPFLQQQGRGMAANADPLLQQQNGLHIGAGAGKSKGLFGRFNGGPLTGSGGQLTAAGQQGSYIEPLMGVGLVDVNETISQQAKMVHPEGVLVTGVLPGGPADTAGIQRGDILVRIAGRKILNIASLNKLLSSQNIGRKFELIYLRNGSRQAARIKTGIKNQAAVQQPRQAGQMQEQGAYQWPLGASVSPLGPRNMMFTKTGVCVQNSGGILAANGLRNGDIIKAINGKQVEDLETFIKQSKKVNSKKGFMLDVIRSGNSIFLTVKG
ncbi:MAG TPA: PDZ domain-containing protein [Desulfuromonadales bacterium]|nr:PDZ domain-containing protein [Desulfuromonadales bacterium]